MMMARKGRRRGSGQREPNGRLARLLARERTPERDPMGVAKRQPHRRHLPEALKTDQRAESELGRLYLAGRLAPIGTQAADEVALARLWAGQRYARLMRAYLRALAAPVTTGSAGFAYVSETPEDAAEFDPLAHIVTAENAEERHARLVGEVSAITDRLAVHHDGKLMRAALDAVCLYDQTITREAWADLGRALAILAHYWRIDAEPARQTQTWVGERPAWDDTTAVVVKRGKR